MNKENQVAKPSKALMHMAEEWELVSTLLGGTFEIRTKGEKYLPKFERESDNKYQKRLQTATLFPAYSRTIDILSSKPFSKSLTLKTPANIEQWLENADLQGRDIDTFASDVFYDALAYGACGVLVEFPVSGDIKSLAQEKEAGLRPYFVHYRAKDVLGWREEVQNGVSKLIQLRLRECKMEADGEFGEKEVEYIRVLKPGSWELWKKNEKDDWVLSESGVTTIKEIPFVPFYGNRNRGFMCAKPALIELAHLNIEHYQSSSDQRNILHVARVPILALIGVNESDEVVAGSSSAANLPMGADMKFVEHSGAAIGAGRESILDLEERMRQTGAELLVIQPGKITATQVYTEDEGNKCALQRIVESFESSMNRCLQFMADWVGESDGGSVELFKDFGAASLTDASAQILLAAANANKISDATLIEEYKRRGILSYEINADDEKDRISLQGPALSEVA